MLYIDALSVRVRGWGGGEEEANVNTVKRIVTLH